MSPIYQLEDRLLEANPKPLGQRVPEPLHERVEQLCELVYEAGEPRRPSKMEMIAALLLAAPTDPEELVELVRRYGRARVRDTLVQAEATSADVINLPDRTSGPRSPQRR